DKAAAAAAQAPVIQETTVVLGAERIRLGVGIASFIDIGPDRIEIKVGNMGLLINNSKAKDANYGVSLYSGAPTEKLQLRADKTEITSLGAAIAADGQYTLRTTKAGFTQ